MRRRDTRVDASSGYCRRPARPRAPDRLLRRGSGGGVGALPRSRVPAPAALVAVALDLAGELVGHEVDRVHQVGRALPRPQRDALELERGLGDLLRDRGFLAAARRRSCARSETCLPIRAVKRSSTCCRSASVTAVLRPLISIFTVDLPLSAEWLGPPCYVSAGRCANGLDACAPCGRSRPPPPPARPRPAAPARRRRGSRRSCRRRPPGSRGAPRRHRRRCTLTEPRALRCRSARPRPTCGAHGAPGAARRRPRGPVSRASARAIACAWSKPRRRLPAGWPGTGTSTPASSSPRGRARRDRAPP